MKALEVETVRTIIHLADLADGSDKEFLEPPIGPSDAEKALVEAIDDLSADEQAELTALAWLGRGDQDQTKEEFPALVSDARDNIQNTSGYLTEKPLARYLRDGLLKLLVYATPPLVCQDD